MKHKYSTYNFAHLNGLMTAFSIWNDTFAAIWPSWLSYGKSIGCLWCSFWIHFPFLYAKYLPTYHTTCSKTILLSVISRTYSKGLTYQEMSYFLLLLMGKENNNRILEALTWLCIPPNINQPQLKSLAYKTHIETRNATFCILPTYISNVIQFYLFTFLKYDICKSHHTRIPKMSEVSHCS